MTKEILGQVLSSPAVLFFLVAAIAFVSAILVWRENRMRNAKVQTLPIESKDNSAKEKRANLVPLKKGELAEVIPLKPPTNKDSGLMFEIGDSPIEPWGGVDPAADHEREAAKKQIDQLLKEKEELSQKSKNLEKKVESLEQVKAELTEQLKAREQVASAQAPENQTENDKLKEELELLRARLKEYEIIEDDIADLAMYKEEVLTLREEIAGLRNSQGSGASTAPVEAPSGSPAPPAVDSSVDDDIMAEFSKALDEQKAQKDAPPPPPPSEQSADALDGSLDVDKMMEEASQLDQVKVSDSDETDLEKGLDSDKLLEEANSLNAGEGA